MPGLTETPGISRTINFSYDNSKQNVPLGFNVRGGAEFGLGIFISGITAGSIAESSGFMTGDQILSINGKSLDGISHREAVKLITSNSNLSVMVTSTGKIPEEEMPIGKYSWITNTGERIVEDCVDGLSNENSDPPKPSLTSANNNQSFESDSTDYIVNKTNIVNSTVNKESVTCSFEGSQKSKTDTKRGSKKSRKSSKKKSGSVKNKNNQESMQFERNKLVNELHEIIKSSFSVEESEIIKQAIATYHNGESVENFLNRILPLFTPLKFSLLRSIRKVVYADEVLKYDGLIISYLGRKKREFLVGGRSQSVRSTSAWSEDKYQEGSLRSEPFPARVNIRVPLPGMRELADTKIVLQSEKRDTEKTTTDQKDGDESPPTTFHFQPVETQPVISKSVQELKHDDNVSRNSSEGHDEVDDLKAEKEHEVDLKAEKGHDQVDLKAEKGHDEVDLKAEKGHDEVDLKAEKGHDMVDLKYEKGHNEVDLKAEKGHNEVDFKAEVKHEPSPAPLADTINSEPRKATTVVTKVERTEVIRQRVHRPCVTINKKVSGDSAVLSIHKRSGDEEKHNSLIFKNSSFDETSNAVTINATLNIGNAKLRRCDAMQCEDDSIKVHPVAVENSATITNDLIVSEPTYAVINKPVSVEDANVTEEGSNMTLHDTFVARQLSYDINAVPVVNSVVTRQLSYDINAVPVVKNTRLYQVDKNQRFIGLSLSGGSDCPHQRDIVVIAVKPDSAAQLAGIQVGQVLLSIDEYSLLDITHAQACQLIRSIFRDKTNNTMKIVTGDED